MSTDFGRKNDRHRDWARESEAEAAEVGDEDTLWQLLSAYADGEATPEEAARVEAHLRADPAYARDLEFLKLASESVQAFPEREPPASLRASIFAATSRRRTLRSRLAVGWSELRRVLVSEPGRVAVPVGALALAGLAILFFHPHSATLKPSGPELALRMPPHVVLPPSVKPEIKPDSHPILRRHKPAAPAVRPHEVESPLLMVENTTTAKSIESKRQKAEHDTITGGQQIAYADTPGTRAAVKSPVLHKANPAPTVLARNKTQRPSAIDPGEAQMVAYSPHPMMDVPNLRGPADGTDSDRSGTFPGPDVESTGLTAKTASASATTAADTAEPKIIVHKAPRLVLSQLPPDSQHVLTGGDIRRLREATRLGYNQETVESIERHQATVAFVGRF